MATALANDGAYSFDPRVAVEHVRASDPVLARVIDAVGPFRLQLKRAPSSFAALAEAIVYQQLSGRAAATIFASVCALTTTAFGRASRSRSRNAGCRRARSWNDTVSGGSRTARWLAGIYGARSRARPKRGHSRPGRGSAKFCSCIQGGVAQLVRAAE